MIERNKKGQFVKGGKPWIAGKHLSEEVKEKIRQKHLKSGLRPPSRKGVKMSKEYKEKISNTRKKLFKEGNLFVPSNKGIPMSEEQKRKISLANKGENSGNWKGGISKISRLIRASSLYKDWTNNVFKRDDYTCQECGQRGTYLQAHHIKPFYKILEDNNIKTLEDSDNCKELWNVDNGLTLCVKCHKKTDSYGWNIYNKEGSIF